MIHKVSAAAKQGFALRPGRHTTLHDGFEIRMIAGRTSIVARSRGLTFRPIAGMSTRQRWIVSSKDLGFDHIHGWTTLHARRKNGLEPRQTTLSARR